MKYDKRIIIIALIIFVNVMGNGLVLPLLPFFAENLGANFITIGLFLSTYYFFSIIAGSYLGALSDKYGRKPILLFSVAGSVVGYLILGFAGTIPLLFLSRIIDGISAGNSSSAKAAIADITTKEERVSTLGVTFAAESLGLIFGPIIGGLFSQFGIGFSGYIAAALAFICFLLILFFFDETRDFQKKSENSKKSIFRFDDFLITFRNSKTRILVLLVFVVQLLITMMWGTIAIYTKNLFGFSARDVSLVSSFAAVIGIFSQLVLLRLLVKLKKDKIILIVGFLFMSLGLVFIGTSTVLALLLIGIGLMAACFNILMPTLTGLVSKLSSEDEQGNVMGTLQSLIYGGSLIGPVIANAILGTSMRGTYFIAAAIGIFALILSLTFSTSKK